MVLIVTMVPVVPMIPIAVMMIIANNNYFGVALSMREMSSSMFHNSRPSFRRNCYRNCVRESIFLPYEVEIMELAFEDLGWLSHDFVVRVCWTEQPIYLHRVGSAELLGIGWNWVLFDHNSWVYKVINLITFSSAEETKSVVFQTKESEDRALCSSVREILCSLFAFFGASIKFIKVEYCGEIVFISGEHIKLID